MPLAPPLDITPTLISQLMAALAAQPGLTTTAAPPAAAPGAAPETPSPTPTPTRFVHFEIPMLKSDSVKTLMCTLAPHEFEDWAKRFLGRCKRHHPIVKELLRQFDVYGTPFGLGAFRATDELMIADGWLASNLDNVLDRSKEHVKGFVAMHDASYFDSGTLLLDAIKSYHAVHVGADVEKLERDFAAASYFTWGMPYTNAIASARRLLDEYAVLPKSKTKPTMPNILALIDKMPISPVECFAERSRLRNIIVQSEITRTAPPFDESMLTRMIAVFLSSVTQASAVVASAEFVAMRAELDRVKKQFGNGGGGRGGGRGDGGRGDRSGGSEHRCLNCGSPSHKLQDCPAKCTVSGFPYCKCTRGEPCPFTDASKRPDASTLNAVGRKLPPHLLTKLQKKHDELFGRSTSSATTETKTAGMPSTSVAEAPTFIITMADAIPTTSLPSYRYDSLTSCWIATFLIDGGSNIVIVTDAGLARAGIVTDRTPVPITPLGSGAVIAEYRGEISICPQTAGAISLPFAYAPAGGPRNIISESALNKTCGATVYKEPSLNEDGTPDTSIPSMVIRFKGRNDHPIYTVNGLYFADFRIPAPTVVDSACHVSSVGAIVATAPMLQALWAQRLGVGTATLSSTVAASQGMPFSSVSRQAAAMIESDRYRAMAHIRRAPAAQHASTVGAATAPGERLMFDASPAGEGAKSIVTGCSTQLICIDQFSDRPHIADVKNLEQPTWQAFSGAMVRFYRDRGFKVRFLRFDLDPALRSFDFIAVLEALLEVVVELAGRHFHEGVNKPERRFDVITRVSEADLSRGQLGRSCFLPLRTYAVWRDARTVRSGQRLSPLQLTEKRTPNYGVTDLVPYLAGTDVVVLNEDSNRGPKGTPLDSGSGRSSDGRVLGIEGASYIVLKYNNVIIKPRRVKVLNELNVLARGFPSGTAQASIETQADDGTAPPPPPPPRAPAQATRTVLVIDPSEAPVGMRTRHWWKDASGDGGRWYDGTVTALERQTDGELQHLVKYDGFAEPWRHNLAKDRASGRLPWFVRPAALVPKPPSATGVPTRRSSRLQALYICASLVSSCELSPNPAAALDASVFQLLGPVASQRNLTCDSLWGPQFVTFISDLCSTIDSVISSDGPTISLAAVLETCSKAEARSIEVTNKDGSTSIITIPRSIKEWMTNEHREQWMAAARVGLDSLLFMPENELCDVTEPAEKGLPIAPCVSDLKVKKIAETGALDKFKVRHCFGNPKWERDMTMLGKELPHLGSATVAHDYVIKMILSDVPTRKRRTAVIDIKDAHARGEGKIDFTYMATPSCLPSYYSEAGVKQCIRLGGWAWGEAPAGMGWQMTLTKVNAEFGAHACEAVPCLYSLRTSKGDLTFCTIVDDIFFSEGGDDDLIGRAYDHYCKTWGADAIKFTRDVRQFVGYQLVFSPQRDILTVHMSEAILMGVRRFIPEIRDDGVMPADSKRVILYGVDLQRACDGLEMTPDHGKKLTRDQKLFQEQLGLSKHWDKILLCNMLFNHRASCVMTRPPLDGYVITESILVNACVHRHDAITFGGADLETADRLNGSLYTNVDLERGSAARDTEGWADSTWSERPDRHLYAFAVSRAGGVVCQQIKKIGLLTDSSFESEAVATNIVSEMIEHGQDIERALGVATGAPAFIATDNKANMLIGTGKGVSTRSRHVLRRYHVLQQRVAKGRCTIGHVPDAEMPVDFMTKWVKASKITASIAFLTNSRNSLLAPTISKRRR